MQSLVSVEVGGESFPYIVEPRCHVCSSNLRLDVESALVKGMTYETIAETFGESDKVNARGVMAHVIRGHMPINAPAVRAVADARSEEVSEVISPLIRGATANLSFAHAVVDRVRIRLESGEVQPNVRDGLAAMRLITECEAASSPVDANEWQSEFMTVFEVVKAIMTPAQFDDLATRLNTRNREREGADGKGPEPRAPHRRPTSLDGRGLETERTSVTAPAPDPTNLGGMPGAFMAHDEGRLQM